MIGRTSLLRVVTAGIVLSATPTAGQSLDSSMRAECVGGILGCSQVDFFLNIMSDGASTTLDYLNFELLGSGWSFLYFVEGEDAIDYLLVNSVGSGQSMRAEFDPFVAEVAPVLRVRAEMDVFQDDAASLFYSYQGGTADNPNLVAATVTPEPVSMVLLGSGLAGIGLARRRRNRNAEDAIS